jgi:hypothetical protein
MDHIHPRTSTIPSSAHCHVLQQEFMRQQQVKMVHHKLTTDKILMKLFKAKIQKMVFKAQREKHAFIENALKNPL